MLDELIEAVARDESWALVVQGEPGVGKTALPDYLARRAAVTGQGTGQGVDGCDGTALSATVITASDADLPLSGTAGPWSRSLA